METILELADPWVYFVVFALAYSEGGLLIGLFLPGESSMLLGGFLVFQGNAELSWMLLAACGGSVIGDSVGYYLGHRHGNRLRRTWLGRKVGHTRWEAVDRFLHERSGRTIFFAKFLGVMRTLVPPAVGASAVPYRRFVMFNVPAAIVWVALFVSLGALAGGSWRLVERWAGRWSLAVLALIAIAIVTIYIRRRNKPVETS
ncbi:MAG: DedA family protein [Actinomycetota bacterium]